MSKNTFDMNLPLSGMTCASCAAHIEKGLRELHGIARVNVNLATESANLVFSDGFVETDLLVEAVRSTGYDVPTEHIVLPIAGMTCASCAAHVEGALWDVPGVLSANVNLATERANVVYVPGVVSITDLKQAVAETGYRVAEGESSTTSVEPGVAVDPEVRKMKQSRLRMQVAWGFTVPITLWMFAEMFFGIVWPDHTIFNLGMIVLAMPVLFWVGWPTFRGAWAAVSHGHANMDTLIALGTLVSLMIGKPVAAWLSHLTRGWPLEWFWRADVKPAYREVTWIWALLIAARLGIQVYLFQRGDAAALAWANTLLGWPVTIAVLVLSYIYGIWRLRSLGGPGVHEFRAGKNPPWEGQTRGF